MKKTLLFFVVAIAITLSANAQLIYDSNGFLSMGGGVPTTRNPICLNAGGFKIQKDNSWLVMELPGMYPYIFGSNNQIRFCNTSTQLYNSIAVSEVFNLSDESSKTNIETITGGLQTILSLNPVSYNWKPAATAESRSAATPVTGEKQYGFLAQEVEAILPGAVMTDEEGRKLVNYTTVIPLLVEAVQSLQAEVARLSATPMQTRSAQGLDEAGAEAIELSQNVPNPFNVSTDIHFTIPQTVQQARLFIYNLQGNQLKNMQISERGKSKITIQANELTPGMYIYALVADGKEVANKRMILTD